MIAVLKFLMVSTSLIYPDGFCILKVVWDNRKPRPRSPEIFSVDRWLLTLDYKGFTTIKLKALNSIKKNACTCNQFLLCL